MKSLLLLPLLGTSLIAANWPQWRGPDFNGSSPEKTVPLKWSQTENVAWSAEMPGPSASTPIVWENRVFVPAADPQSKALLAMCYDRKTGKLLWKEQVGTGYRRDEKSNYASPSPSTDGERVFFFYGNGDLAGFSVDGKKLWQRNIQTDYGDFAFQWTFSSSPLLHKGKLYLQVLQRDVPVHGKGKQGGESYFLAMDPATGKTLWKVQRPTEAVAESREAFSTPVPYTFNGREEILIAGGDMLSGSDPETGKELWRWGTWNPTRIGHWRLVPSPVAGDGIVLGCAPKRDPIYAVKAGGSGTLDNSWLAWKSDTARELSSDVPTPAFYDGDFFVLSDVRKSISRVEPKTGKVKWSKELPGNAKFEASPTAAAGHLYLQNFKGDVVVVDAKAGEITTTVGMGDSGDDETRSVVAVAHGQLFIRTNHKLFVIGK
jgi:outer membrane protein assembly factor BamB